MAEPTTMVPNIPQPPLVFRGAGMTHAGQMRDTNEDTILTDPTGIFWAIADGMGGYGNGDVASEIVIDHLSRMPDGGKPLSQIDALLRAANDAILARAAAMGADRMGATAIVLKLDRWVAYLAWAGDCRAYLWREGGLRQLTRDHTVVEELIHDGVLERESARGHSGANIVTRAVGAEPILEIDHLSVPLFLNDRILLCSDGLTACLEDDEIGRQIAAASDPDTACRFLVAKTLEAGAPDNVSVITVFAEGD